jgi:hypothetical protein
LAVWATTIVDAAGLADGAEKPESDWTGVAAQDWAAASGASWSASVSGQLRHRMPAQAVDQSAAILLTKILTNILTNIHQTKFFT